MNEHDSPYFSFSTPLDFLECALKYTHRISHLAEAGDFFHGEGAELATAPEQAGLARHGFVRRLGRVLR